MSDARPTDAASITAAVRGILATVGARPDLDGLGDTDSLLATGVVDSVAMIGLVSALEERFGISIDDAELVPEHFDSVRAIVSLVSRKTGVPQG